MPQPRTPTDSFECRLAATVLRPDGDRVTVPAVLRFATADPFAVEIRLRFTDGTDSAWFVAREILASRSDGQNGLGDVRARSTFHGGRHLLALSLAVDGGRTEIELPQSRVATFLRDTYAAVPAGMECDLLDWDEELRRLFDDSAS